MSNAIRFINQMFEFKNSGISCLALIFNLKHPSTTVLLVKKRFQVARNDYSGFRQLLRIYGSVLKAGSSESCDISMIWLVAVSPVTWVCWVLNFS